MYQDILYSLKTDLSKCPIEPLYIDHVMSDDQKQARDRQRTYAKPAAKHRLKWT